MKQIYYAEYSDDRIDWYYLCCSFYLLHCVDKARQQPYPWRIRKATMIDEEGVWETEIQDAIKQLNLLEKIFQ